MRISIDIIADYGGKTGFYDLAFAEVKNKISSIMAEKKMDYEFLSSFSVNSFNTIETGFIVSQLGFNSHLKHHIIYHNTAPRKDNSSARVNNDGESLAMALLPNGVLVVGVCAGYTFSFIKNVTNVYSVNCAHAGSQFRSRDTFPTVLVDIAQEVFEGNLKDLSKSKYMLQKIDHIPDIHDNTVLYIDGYGNLKTSLPVSTLENKGLVRVIINETAHSAYISNDGIFGVEDGGMVIAKGSSGWKNIGNNFLEISVRGGSAAEKFNNPKPGDKIILS